MTVTVSSIHQTLLGSSLFLRQERAGQFQTFKSEHNMGEVSFQKEIRAKGR